MPLQPLSSRWLAPLFIAPLLGCPAAPSLPAAPETSTPAPETSPPRDTVSPPLDASQPLDPASRALAGRLSYRPIDPVKSVEAYDGLEFFIATSAGTVPLAPGPAWPTDKLKTYDGRDVRVRCTMMTPPPPRPDESYPIEADGRPMARTARCQVLGLE